MADDKKNKEALDALHKLQNAHASTSSVSKTDWSKVTDASSFTKTANAAADSVKKEYTKNVDSDYINSFLKDSRLHMNSATSDNVRMGVATSKSIYESRMKAYGDLHKRSYEISRYLEDNKDNIDEETYKSLKDYLDAFDKASSQTIHSFYRNQKFYSQFKTQEEYDKYVTEKEAYEAKVNLDLDAAAKEIEDLKAKRFDYANNHQFDLNDHAQREEYDKAIAEMGKQIAQKEQYLNQARHLQEGVKLSSVADPFSKSYDRNFRDLSQYTSTYDDSAWSKLTSTYGMGYKDLTYEYINNQDGIRDEIKQNYRTYSHVSSSDGESIFEQNGYDYLTKDEVAIYNYYYAKEGKAKAEEYLDSIQETLNYRKATSMYQNMEDKTGLELAFGVAAGLDQFTSGVKNLFNTEDDYIAQTAYQMASGMVREDLADKGAKLPDWMGGASMGQAGYDLITTSANMAPSILASTAANIILPGSGKIVGNTLMGMSAAGNAYQQALNEGYDKSQARAYSTMIGASEAILGELLGGISTLGGTSAAVTNMLNGVDNAFLRFIGLLGGSMFSEGLEEGLQEVLAPMFSNFFMNTDKKVNWSEVAYSALLGALSAGIMEGPSIISGEVSTYQTGRQLQAADISAQRIADIGKTFSADTVAYQLAGRVDENTGAYTMGRLFNEIGATMTEQNVNDITNALVREGIPEKIAKNKAKLMAKIVEGAELTEDGIRAIESDTLMSRVMKTTFVDSNSTWFQRSNGYKDVLKALAQEKASRTEQATPGQESQANPDKVDAENKNATEDSSAADIPAAKVSKISTIKDGKVTLTMEDGSEVDITKADIDPEDGVIIETIAKIGGISAADANYIMATLKTTPGISAQVAALGAKEAYQYGFYGMSDAHMGEHGVFVNSLPKAQREAIYKTGRDARARDTAAQQATVSKKESVATSEESSQVDNKLATDAKKVGKVHFDGDRSKLTNRQKASLTAMEKVADIMGVQIHVFESKVGNNGKRIGANGWYDPRDNSIHIDLHSGANGEGTMLFTLSHELTHHIRKWSPEKFKVLSDFLMEEYGNKGVNVDALVRKQQEKAMRNGRTISYDTAWEEVVADSMETMLADGNVLNRLEKLKAKDKDLWYEIKRIINDLADKIRAVYKGMTPDSMEGRIVADMGKTVYRLQELFADALMDASENYQASLTPGEDGVVANQNGEPVAHATADGTVQLSMRTYEEDGRNELRKYLQKCVSSNKLTKAEMQEMMDGIEEIYQVCKEFKDQYAPFSSWSDAAVVRDTYGKPVFSVVTPNGDYKMNLDFSLVCKKRRTLDAVFNEMSRRGIIDNFELGQKSVVKINEIIRKYGLETACALCFVDAKRFRQASMADQFTNLYNELVLSLVPEDQRSSIEHFNFGGYDTIKKVDGGIHTWNASKLDFSHLDEVMKNYGKGTVEHKAAKYIKSHPEGRKLLLRGDFMSSQGFDAVKTQNKDILKLYNSKKGTGGPKAAFGDVQYMNEIVKKARTWTPAKAYAVGGVRIQSFSDYVPRMVFYYTQMIYDLAATKLPAHAYTKEAMFVKQFGLTGVKINMSLIPAIAEGGIAPGLDANGNYVWAGESFDYETAKEIQNAEGYTENCGTICVGVSKQHIEKLLRDPNIRMVIPYHKSGLNPIVAHMNKIAEFTDYTNDQRTKGKDGKALSKDFDFSKALHDMGDKANPKAVADQYLKWCAANGYTAKFAEFAMEENYYKLLEDFTLYDKDGNYVPQREVRAVFPKADSAFGSMKDLIQEGLQEDAVVEGKRDKNLSAIVDEIQKTLPKTEAEIEETQVAQADRDLEAEVKYSMRDMDINRTFIEYGDVASEKAAIDKTVASLIAEGKTIEITAKEVDRHRSSGEWDKKKESRLYLKRILKGFLGKSVYFNHNGIKAEAYLTKEGFNHSSVGLNVPEKATAFSKYRELIANAEYSYSSKNDTHSNANKRISGKIDWDCFVATAMIENEPYPVVFKVRTIDSDVRSQIYRMATKNEIGSTHDYGQQNNLPDALPNYGGTPISGDMVSQPASEVKKFSDRDTAPTFYSHMARVVDGVKQEKLGAASVVNMLRGKGVKAEEIKWSGIEAWLDGKKSVTKAELQEFIAGSMLQIDEDMLTDQEIPYSQEHLDQIAKFEAERDTIAENLKSEWKRIVGTDIPITYFGAGLESALVNNLLLANQEKKGNTEAGYKYKAARAALQRCIEYSDDYYGFDNERQALREAVRNPKDFMNSYELSSFEKGVFRDFIKAKEAYNKVEGISMQDQRALIAIAASADRFSNRINKVKNAHRAEAAKYLNKYRSYTIKGGTNYRELLFRVPGSTYSNGAMNAHWDRPGVLAHARIQDLNTFLGKMLFIEEIQSDWHNEGHKTDYHGVPDAPFRDTYHEYVLKRLIRMAAENGYDSIGWTTADIQSKRWSDEYAEGYRIEYDQDIPKFLNKYGKKWGTKVGKTVLDNGTEVWSMAITDSMQESVLTDGQPLYSDRDTDSVSNRSLLANALESVAQNDIERKRLQEYKEKIGLINAEEQKLQELNLLLKAESNPKRMREIQFDAQQTANRINTYDRQLLRLEASRPLKDVLTREKKMAYDRGVQKGKDAMEAYRVRAEKKQEETRERYKESRQKTEMRHKVQNVVKELNDLLLNENKKRHVPDSLKKAVADALSLVNMDTVGAEERAANYANLIAKEQAKANPDQDKIDAYTVTMENILRQGEKMGQKLKELRDAYEEIQESNDPDIANAYDPVIAGCLKELSQSIGNTSLRNMTVEQLSDVYDMYRMVLTRVRDANKTLLQNIKESISNLASRVIVEVRVSGGEHKYRASVLDPAKKFLWNNLKPVYAMEHIGSSTLTKVFNNVRAGEDVWAKDVTEARAYYLDKSKKYGYDSWDFKKKYRFASDSDLEFELTLEQILSLYAYSKREQALEHLRLGGFVFDSNIETYKNKDGKTGKSILKYKVNTADAHQITPEILANIIGKLSAEQKGFVDEMQDYLSTTMGAKGNEVTMAMYGVKLFKEKFYFPLKSAKQFMFEQNEVSGEVRIKNSGFTNKVVAKANNPVILSNFMDVWTGHVNDMSMYHAFVLPLEDFNRVFNYNTPKMEGQPPVSVKGTIQGAYSPAAVSYVKNLITDLNGGARTDSTTGPINKLMGMFKKGAVFASASVVIQQPSAIARATAIIDTKYFIGPKVDHKKHKALWEEVKQYAPVAIIKEMGYFDTNMGKSTDDFIKGKEYSGIQDKAKALVTDSGYRDEVLSKAPALADEIAWCAIWEAAKRETKAKHPGMDAKSDAFLKLAGDRFTEVITKTQVYDSVLSRSANMRSKDTGMKMATAFMAEPTTSINMVADALLKAKRGDKKTCRKAICSVVASVILNSFLVAWVYAARDDDEDETYREKYLSSFISGIADGVNPMTYIPFLKDIVSIVQGYDVERSDMAVISDLWSAWKQLKNDDVSAWRKVEGFVGSICQIFGLPVKNIMRDVRSVFQAYDTIVHGEKNTTRGTAIAIVEGITGKKPSNPEQLYAARKRGDEEHAARVEGRYDDEKSADAAVRKAITDRYMDDKLTLAQATMQLTQYAGMKPDEAYWLMRGWKHKKETGSDDYGKYNDFYEAVQTGKDLKAVIKEYTDNGVKQSTLSSQITSHFKDEYVAMSAAERANIKGYLLNAYEQCGVSRKNAEERLREWDFEAKHGASYEEIVADYKNGNINETTMRSILAEKGYSKSDIEDKIHDWNVYKIYGHEYSELDDAYRAGELSREEFRQAMIDNGTFPAKADQAIITYDWMRDNAHYGLEYSDAGKYAHPIENYGYSLEDVGLDPKIYLEYKELKKGCKGVDADNDGTADSGTLRAAKFEMIDSLPITNEQKDALAAIDYSMKSIKRYAPWH